MRTQSDIITEVLVRNNRTTTDGFITDAILKNWYVSASAWAAAHKKWPFTEGKSSTTYSTAITDDLGNSIVPYPEGWKADSIRILTIGGKRMQKTEFSSFLRFIESNPRDNSRMYSDYSRQLYVNVNADVSGTLTAYGQYTPYIDVTDESALSIFSGYDEEGNEALIEKMTSFLHIREGGTAILVRGHPVSPSIVAEQNAISILEGIWKRIGDEQYAYQTKNQGMFEDFDVIRGRFRDALPRQEDQF